MWIEIRSLADHCAEDAALRSQNPGRYFFNDFNQMQWGWEFTSGHPFYNRQFRGRSHAPTPIAAPYVARWNPDAGVVAISVPGASFQGEYGYKGDTPFFRLAIAHLPTAKVCANVTEATAWATRTFDRYRDAIVRIRAGICPVWDVVLDPENERRLDRYAERLARSTGLTPDDGDALESAIARWFDSEHAESYRRWEVNVGDIPADGLPVRMRLPLNAIAEMSEHVARAGEPMQFPPHARAVAVGALKYVSEADE